MPTPQEQTLSLVSSGAARGKPGSADLQRWQQALQQENDEQGSTVSTCDSTHTKMKSFSLIY
jgi:hypothetical protein